MLHKRPLRIATVIVTVVSCVAIIALVVGRRTSPTTSAVQAQQEPIEPGSIDDMVQKANAEGRVFVNVPMSIMDEQADGFDDASTNYTILVAQPVSKESFAIDSYGVETWYKFTITETLATATPHICFDNECPLRSELSAAGSNEMWLEKSGGAIVRNGVTVNFQWAGFPDFNIGQTYLLFVDLNQTTRIGVPAIGASGVYLVDSNGYLSPVGEESDVSSDISSLFANSLTQLRNTLNPSPPPPPPAGCDPAQQQDCLDNGGSWNANNCTCFNVCIQKPWLCD